MTQKGAHTWDLYLRYHKCPKCGYIIECRNDYENRFGKYIKELTCNRCSHRFTLEKSVKPTFGPLLGDPQPVEINWDSSKS